MAVRNTEHQVPGKFSQSVGAGMKSLFKAGKRTYYILEYKNPAVRFKAGQFQEIIIDYVELGRDQRCQVQFGNAFPTVSRRHAAIAREGNQWVVKHLGSNPTLINGRPVAHQWFLQNGDEIQLSMEGPKLGFLIPADPTVGSIGFTRRMSLFRSQALRPYRQAIAAMAILFVLAVAVLGFFLFQSKHDIQELRQQNIELVESATRFTGNIDSLNRVVAANESANHNLQREMRRLKELVHTRPVTPEGDQGTVAPPPFEPLFPFVYHIVVEKIVLRYQGQTESVTDVVWSGTGFLLSDGRFVTARHIIESWYFLHADDEAGIALNKICNNGGSVTAHFRASAPGGGTFTFTNTDFKINRSNDEAFTANDNDGNTFVLRKARLEGGNDWAVMKTNRTGGLAFNDQIAQTLPQQQKLHLLGYPLGLGSNPRNLSPIYGNCTVSSAGLSDGLILVTDRNFERGNSGGPVFYLDPNLKNYVVVGLVSAGAGGSTGFIIPISNL